ncbi:MAG: cell division protein FtsB [Herminiimonas sp.]|nr:cell division protein FtsB [Herminiimonas sp.]
MRLILVCVATMLLLIQYPLWLGKGGWLRAWDLDQQVKMAHRKTDEIKARNAKLNSEVRDLKDGTGAIEERARSELGMIKDDEIFVQILQGDVSGKGTSPQVPAGASATAPATATAPAIATTPTPANAGAAARTATPTPKH